MKLPAIAGLVGGCLLILSSAAHAFLGWPAVRTALEQAKADDELTSTVAIGWLFGRAAMLAFGLIVLWVGVRLWRDRQADRKPALVIGACYLVFGLAAFFRTHFNPHFIGFIVIGVITPVAATGGRTKSSAR